MRYIVLIVLVASCTSPPPNPAARCAGVCAAFHEPGCPSHLGTGCEENCAEITSRPWCQVELDNLLACQEAEGCIDMATNCRSLRNAFTACELEVVP